MFARQIPRLLSAYATADARLTSLLASPGTAPSAPPL
jgi:hypothetical protein